MNSSVNNLFIHADYSNNRDLFKKLKFTFLEQENCYKYLQQSTEELVLEGIDRIEYKCSNLKNIIRKEKTIQQSFIKRVVGIVEQLSDGRRVEEYERVRLERVRVESELVEARELQKVLQSKLDKCSQLENRLKVLQEFKVEKRKSTSEFIELHKVKLANDGVIRELNGNTVKKQMNQVYNFHLKLNLILNHFFKVNMTSLTDTHLTLTINSKEYSVTIDDKGRIERKCDLQDFIISKLLL